MAQRKSSRINTKLSYLVFGGFAIILILSTISTAQSTVGLLNTTAEFEGLIDGALATEEHADELNIDLLLARRYEKDFIARGDTEDITDHNRGFMLAHSAQGIFAILGHRDRIIVLHQDMFQMQRLRRTVFDNEYLDTDIPVFPILE